MTKVIIFGEAVLQQVGQTAYVQETYTKGMDFDTGATDVCTKKYDEYVKVYGY